MSQEEEGSYKVVLLGESGVGKTSIINQFINEEFLEDQETTTGATFSSKEVETKSGQIIKFVVWDTAGQEKYRALTKMFYKNAIAAILVYDITRKDSFEELKNYWAQQIKESSSKNIIVCIAANKCDLLEYEEVEEGEGRKLAEELNAIFKSTSAKNQTGINDLFYAIANKIVDPSYDVNNDDDDDKDDKNDKSNKGNVKINQSVQKEKDNEKKNQKKKCCR